MSWVILLNKAWMEDRQSDSFSSEKTKENLVTNFKAAFVGNKLGLNSWVICNGDNGGGYFRKVLSQLHLKQASEFYTDQLGLQQTAVGLRGRRHHQSSFWQMVEPLERRPLWRCWRHPSVTLIYANFLWAYRRDGKVLGSLCEPALHYAERTVRLFFGKL